MSFNYRFEPPTLNELDELSQFDQDCDHECETCFWDCEEGDDL